MTFSTITVEWVDGWMRGLAYLSPASRRRAQAAVSSFWKWAARRKLVDPTIMVGMDPVKIPKKLPVYLTVEELERLEAHVRSALDKAIVRTMYDTGCRVMEIAGMRLGDLDLQGQRVKVHGKGSKDRVVFLTDRSVAAIRKWLGKRKPMGDLVFQGRGGAPLTENAVTLRYARWRRELGIPHLCARTMRHTTATHLHERGMDILFIKSLLGHEDISTTQVYAHVIPKTLEAVYREAQKGLYAPSDSASPVPDSHMLESNISPTAS